MLKKGVSLLGLIVILTVFTGFFAVMASVDRSSEENQLQSLNEIYAPDGYGKIQGASDNVTTDDTVLVYAPDAEQDKTFEKLSDGLSSLFTAELDKSEVLLGGSLNVSGEASETDIVDIVVLGPRGLRRMPESITSEIALADEIRFMTVTVAANNTFEAEIRIPEEIYSGFHHVLIITPGEDGVYGSTTRTGGELFGALLDYVATKGGSEDILPGKSTEQLIDIISAATFNMSGSDDLFVGPLTFKSAATFGDVITLEPISSVRVGEPLIVNGTSKLEDGSLVFLSTISDPSQICHLLIFCSVESGRFKGVLDTTDAVPGNHIMQAEDERGNIDDEPFELLATVSSASLQTLNKTAKPEAINAKGENVVFDMPYLVVIGETWDLEGATTASGDLDIVIDDILMVDDLPIDSWGEFEWEWNTKNPLPHMGTYTTGPCFIKVYLNCHIAGVSAGDYVRTDYKSLDPDGVCGVYLVSPAMAVEMEVSVVEKGGSIDVLGTVLGTGIVDIVVIGPEGLKELPVSFFSEEAIAKGLYFTSTEVTYDEFEKIIDIPNEAEFGDYQLFVIIPGRDSLYALSTRDEGDLFDALLDYGWSANDFVGRNQTQIIAMLGEATYESAGSDDLAVIQSFSVIEPGELPIHNINTGENFSTIQAAINDPNTENGHTITVDPRTYTENVDVTKSLTIRSSSGNPSDTIVQAKTLYDHVFDVRADYVNISEFTVKGATGTWRAGIFLSNAHHCNISNNNASNNNCGIYMLSSSNNTIRGNCAYLNNYYGILLTYSSNNNFIDNNNANFNTLSGILIYSSSNNNTISHNDANSNEWGLYLDASINNTVEKNTANSNNLHGIKLDSFSNNNTVRGNTANSNNHTGICLSSSNNNLLIENAVNLNAHTGFYLYPSCNNNTLNNNLVKSNNQGIDLFSFNNNNLIYHNNIINNTGRAYDDTNTNAWDNGYPSGGNYWSNYGGSDDFSGPYQDIPGSDGIGDTPYTISGYAGAQDRYPFMKENGWLNPYTKVDVGVTSNITVANSSDITAYLPPEYDGMDISDAVVLNVDVTDDTPGNPVDDAYTDITINVGAMDIETCKVFKAGMGFLPEVDNVTALPTVDGEPAFSRNPDNYTVTIRLYVGDPLLGVVPAEPKTILDYYRSWLAAGDPNVVETQELLKAADDWSNDLIPPGFPSSITTQELLQLADEWAVS